MSTTTREFIIYALLMFSIGFIGLPVGMHIQDAREMAMEAHHE